MLPINARRGRKSSSFSSSFHFPSLLTCGRKKASEPSFCANIFREFFSRAWARLPIFLPRNFNQKKEMKIILGYFLPIHTTKSRQNGSPSKKYYRKKPWFPFFWPWAAIFPAVFIRASFVGNESVEIKRGRKEDGVREGGKGSKILWVSLRLFRRVLGQRRVETPILNTSADRPTSPDAVGRVENKNKAFKDVRRWRSCYYFFLEYKLSFFIPIGLKLCSSQPSYLFLSLLWFVNSDKKQPRPL